ncbi:hypothetical protein [Caulobacter sp. DWP3-1-3b2]|uniref:hypothetical protein n=1 Tax=Caulobacter sp. DWP3-1-3b2 TaxID=2804643 RepID=UPI003CF31625
MTRSATITQAKIKTAILGAKAAGIHSPCLRLLANGDILISHGPMTQTSDGTPQDVLDELEGLAREA